MGLLRWMTGLIRGRRTLSEVTDTYGPRSEAVVLDPEELYEVDSDVPDLTGAVLLHHFEGFMDAGSAGRLTAEHLLSSFEHRVVARFDVDRLIDYRSKRPLMTYMTDHWAEYQAPELVVELLHDTNGTPFLLLTGPEPDHEWERFTTAIRALNERWGVRLTVGMHGIPMGVPHTRPLGVTGHATRPELVGDFQPVLNRLQVPGSVSALLEFRLGENGHDAVGFAAHVPHYLAQASYPAAAVPAPGGAQGARREDQGLGAGAGLPSGRHRRSRPWRRQNRNVQRYGLCASSTRDARKTRRELGLGTRLLDRQGYDHLHSAQQSQPNRREHRTEFIGPRHCVRSFRKRRSAGLADATSIAPFYGTTDVCGTVGLRQRFSSGTGLQHPGRARRRCCWQRL